MRKEVKAALETAQENRTTRLTGYHADYNASANGTFAELRQYTSDRYITLDDLVSKGKEACGYGLEIETVCKSMTDSTVYNTILANWIFKALPNDLLKAQRDGSLSGADNEASAEIITQIMTRACVRALYADWREFFARLAAINAGAALPVRPSQYSNSTRLTCGMHTNISLACFGKDKEHQDKAIAAFIYIVNKYRKTIGKATGRDFVSDHYYAEMDGWQGAFRTAGGRNYMDRHCAEHGDCCSTAHYNDGHASRIEMRIVGPQKDFDHFRNTMELVFHLVDFSKTVKSEADCDSIVKVMAGCNQYAFEAIRSAWTLSESKLAEINSKVKRVEW